MSDENKSEITDYNKEVEDLFISFMMSNPDLFVRCKSIVKSEYFDDRQNRDTVQFICDYSSQYVSLPAAEQVLALTGKSIKLIPEIAATQDAWFFVEIERFCRHKSLRDAILSSPALLDEGRYGEVEQIIKAAVQIGLVKDLGLDYFADPKSRLEAIKDSNGQIKTGWKDVDDKLYGGLNRGEITIFCGQSGAGKSLFLQNLAVNWALAGLNVVYITLELSEKLCSLRLDAMTTGYETREVMKNIDDVDLKIRALHKKHKGEMRVKQLPNGCTATDIRAYIREYEIQSGFKVDGILVDYVDLMMPQSKKISAENLFIKDKYVTEELRNLAVELNVLMVSAAQLNRGSYEEVEYDASHISGGISKVNTSDNVIGIFTSGSMKEAGRYQIQFMKTRSSAGVGSKIDLNFDNKTLRIYDLQEGDDSSIGAASKNIYETLRKKSVLSESSESASATVDDQQPEQKSAIDAATDLRSFLRRKN